MSVFLGFWGRHWRGEYHPSTGFWIAGIVTIAGIRFLTAVWAFGSSSVNGVSPPIVFACGFVVSNILITCVLTWWLVGAFRSFRKSRGTVRTSLAASLSFAVAILAAATVVVYEYSTFLRAVDLFFYLADDPHAGDRGVKVLNDKTVLVYGFLSLSVGEKLEMILAKQSAVRDVELSSPGGRTWVAVHIATLIRDRRLDTIVRNTCVSACALAFLGGVRRLAAESAKIGFHAAADKQFINLGANEYLREWVVRMGASRDFASIAFNSRTMWYPSFAQLRTGRVITELYKQGP